MITPDKLTSFDNGKGFFASVPGQKDDDGKFVSKAPIILYALATNSEQKKVRFSAIYFREESASGLKRTDYLETNLLVSLLKTS